MRHTVRAVDVISSMLFPGELYVEERGDVQGQEIVGCDQCGVTLEGHFNTDCPGKSGVD